jgi:hypothetical protein
MILPSRLVVATRTVIVTLLIGMLTVPTLSAQQPDPATTTKDHPGKVKIAVGLVLIGAGLLVIPTGSPGYPRNGTMSGAAGGGLIGAGIVTLALGLRDRRRALAPELTVGVTARRGVGGVVVRRTW